MGDGFLIVQGRKNTAKGWIGIPKVEEGTTVQEYQLLGGTRDVEMG